MEYDAIISRSDGRLQAARICKVFGVKDGVCKAEWIDSDSVLKAKYYPVEELTHLNAPKNRIKDFFSSVWIWCSSFPLDLKSLVLLVTVFYLFIEAGIRYYRMHHVS